MRTPCARLPVIGLMAGRRKGKGNPEHVKATPLLQVAPLSTQDDPTRTRQDLFSPTEASGHHVTYVNERYS